MNKIKSHSGLLIIVLISILPLLNLLTPGLPITHDGLDHVARIASFYKSLSEGIIIPRWAGSLNWGYGHPILMFLYPLPSYMASFFHLFGFSFINSFKLVLAIAYILSGAFMFLWLKEFLEEKASLLGAVIYLFAPYRFIDLYVRGALGEHVAFIFLPLVLLSIVKLAKRNNKKLTSFYFASLFIAFSFAGLILSHNAISLIFIPFVIFYILYLYFENKDRKKTLLSFSSLFLGFLFSLFFWFPAFIEGKYTLRDIVTKGGYENSFVKIKDLIYGPWSFGGTGQFTVQIGIAAIVLVLISLIFFSKVFKKNDKQKYLYLGGILFLFGPIFLMLKESNFVYQALTILQKLQFPWRFLSLVVFSTSLIGAIFISKINLKNKNLLILILIFLTIIPTISYWHAKQYKQIPESFFTKPYAGTTDTGESSPIWSIRSMDHFPKNQIEIISGNAAIKSVKRTSIYHQYLINVKEEARVRENTLYFPGWKVFDNGNLINIEFQDPKNRGLITFYLNPGQHNLTLKFEDTKLRIVSDYISLLSLVTIVLIPLFFVIISRIKLLKFK